MALFPWLSWAPSSVRSAMSTGRISEARRCPSVRSVDAPLESSYSLAKHHRDLHGPPAWSKRPQIWWTFSEFRHVGHVNYCKPLFDMWPSPDMPDMNFVSGLPLPRVSCAPGFVVTILTLDQQTTSVSRKKHDKRMSQSGKCPYESIRVF